MSNPPINFKWLVRVCIHLLKAWFYWQDLHIQKNSAGQGAQRGLHSQFPRLIENPRFHGKLKCLTWGQHSWIVKVLGGLGWGFGMRVASVCGPIFVGFCSRIRYPIIASNHPSLINSWQVDADSMLSREPRWSRRFLKVRFQRPDYA